MLRAGGRRVCLVCPGRLVGLVCLVAGVVRFPLPPGKGDPFKRAARAFPQNGEENGEPYDAHDDEAVYDRRQRQDAEGDVASDDRETRDDNSHGNEWTDIVLRRPEGDPDDRDDEESIPGHALKSRLQVQRCHGTGEGDREDQRPDIGLRFSHALKAVPHALIQLTGRHPLVQPELSI